MTPRNGTCRGTSVGYRRLSGGLPMSPMPDLLRLHADASGDRTAVIVDEAGGARPAAVSFAELNAVVNRLAHALRSHGMKRGERLVWCGPNSLEVMTAIHAARKAGQIAVPLSYRFNADEMQYVIDNSDATLGVGDAEQAPRVAEIRDRIPKVRAVIAYGGDVPDGFEAWDDVLAAEPDDEPTADESASDAVGAQMLYTSGTTGKPKGAVRTTSDPVIVGALLAELALIPGGEVHLTTGPLYHSGPLAFAVISHTLGCPIVILRKFDPSAWLRLVKEHRVTNTFSAPTQLKRLVSLPPGELARADLSSMRCLIANAAPVPYALKEEIVQKLGDDFLFEVYGSTELGIVTVLKPVGDVAYRDDEGFLYICDRKKDMIILGVVNIYPAEVEAVLYAHPQVLDAAVFGIPDDEWGESVYAVVQAKPAEVIDLAELQAFVDERVAGYKRPRKYELRDELPRTDAGKLLKRVLRDEFWRDRATAV